MLAECWLVLERRGQEPAPGLASELAIEEASLAPQVADEVVEVAAPPGEETSSTASATADSEASAGAFPP